jgi:hypothetical protein
VRFPIFFLGVLMIADFHVVMQYFRQHCTTIIREMGLAYFINTLPQPHTFKFHFGPVWFFSAYIFFSVKLGDFVQATGSSHGQARLVAGQSLLHFL